MAVGGMTIAGRRALPTHYRIYDYEEIQVGEGVYCRYNGNVKNSCGPDGCDGIQA